MTDRAELLLKTTATHFLAIAVSHLHLSLRAAVAYEKTNRKSIKREQEKQAMYHQLMALQADEIAREAQIDSHEMNKFMHLFFATDGIKE